MTKTGTFAAPHPGLMCVFFLALEEMRSLATHLLYADNDKPMRTRFIAEATKMADGYYRHKWSTKAKEVRPYIDSHFGNEVKQYMISTLREYCVKYHQGKLYNRRHDEELDAWVSYMISLPRIMMWRAWYKGKMLLIRASGESNWDLPHVAMEPYEFKGVMKFLEDSLSPTLTPASVQYCTGYYGMWKRNYCVQYVYDALYDFPIRNVSYPFVSGMMVETNQLEQVHKKIKISQEAAYGMWAELVLPYCAVGNTFFDISTGTLSGR